VTFSGGILTQTIEVDEYPEMSQKVLGSLRIFGMARKISKITVNGMEHREFTVRPSGEVKVNKLKIPMNSAYAIAFS